MPAPKADFVGLIDIEMVGNFQQVDLMVEHLMERLTFSELSMFLGADIMPYLRERIADRFAGEGDDVVGQWAPLTPATESIRAAGRAQGMWAVGDAHPINQRTGEMYDYLVNGTWQVAASGGAGVRLTSPKEKQNNRQMRAKIKGAQQGEGKAPPRPVLGMNENDLMFFITALAFHLAKS